MKTILITSDLSDYSKAAFAEANKMAKAFDAHIKLLYVIEDFNFTTTFLTTGMMDVPAPLSEDEQKEIITNAEERLNKIAKTAFPNLIVECFVQRTDDSVYQTINKFAKEINVDLLVIATHGRTGLNRLFLGSVAERVARESHCPVLLVPAREQ